MRMGMGNPYSILGIGKSILNNTYDLQHSKYQEMNTHPEYNKICTSSEKNLILHSEWCEVNS